MSRLTPAREAEIRGNARVWPLSSIATDLLAEIDALRVEQATMLADNAAVEDETDKLRDELAEATAERDLHKSARVTLADEWTRAKSELAEANARVAELERQLTVPELVDFAAGVQLEAAHQRERWDSEHDAGKMPADWFWLVGYLAGKALHAHAAGNIEKALHHTITAAAALANWHAAITGRTNMRPGLGPEAIAKAEAAKEPRDA